MKPILEGIEIELGGETLELFAARAMFRRTTSTLLVADPHFGKAAAFRALGVYVPESTTDANVARLDALLEVTRARRLVFLGDFLHAKEGRHPATLDALDAWRSAHADVEMLLVRGNHDDCAGDPPGTLGIECVNGPVIEGPFAYAHKPKEVSGSYVLAGHVHPAVLLAGAGRQRARLACFWFGANVGVLPAFGEFTGLGDVSPAPGDDVWVIADDQLVQVRG